MVSVFSLWLPILLSAVFVFVASSVIHMAFKYHNADYQKLPDDGRVRDALRATGAGHGFYAVPYTVDVNWKDPAVMEDLARGPNAFITVLPTNSFNHMGKTFGYWFLACVAVSALAAWVAARTMIPGEEYMEVFCVVGIVAFAGYSMGAPTESIWFHRPWAMTFRHMFDGVVYALLTAGTFGWLWPAA